MPRSEPDSAHGKMGLSPDHGPEPGAGSFRALVLSSLGVVYGDIGTSPIYAFREAVAAAQQPGADHREIVFGILSLILWTLTLIVTLKYVLLLLRADNNGEGGTFALMALAQSAAKPSAPKILLLGIAGAAFFYGDAIITPAISVVSAVEGLKLIHPSFSEAVVPVSIAILAGLFLMQSHGTGAIARFFGPITVAWFLALAAGGLLHIADEPSVFAALNRSTASRSSAATASSASPYWDWCFSPSREPKRSTLTSGTSAGSPYRRLGSVWSSPPSP